jgi:5'-nucleotidase
MENHMHILLTNDDGYFAAGLQALYQTLSQESEFEISVVAPDSQKSATGHSITLFQPIFITRHPLSHGLTGFSVTGNPADCVKLAIQGGIVPRPDLVISGINNGPNLGTDVFYSGTVSAAMEGVLLGIPSFAVSLASFSPCDFEPAARFVANLLRENKIPYEKGLLNINIPAVPENEWKGTRVTKLGKAIYENVFEYRKGPHGREYFWQAGTIAPEKDESSDLFAIKEGYVSLTPMHSDLTDYVQMRDLENRLGLTKD